MNDDGDFSELLVDLALIGVRARQAKTKVLLGIRSDKPFSTRRVSTGDALVDVLNRAVSAKQAGKLGADGLKTIRQRVMGELRKLPVAERS